MENKNLEITDENKLLSNIRANIKYRMHWLDINVSELARMIGKSPSTVYGYLKNPLNIDIMTLQTMASRLNVTIKSLIEERE